MPGALKGTVGASVATATSIATPTTLTPIIPSHSSGDLLLCFTSCRIGTPTVATPSGWTQLLNTSGSFGRIALFAKVAASSSETNPGVTWSTLTTGTGGSPAQAVVGVFTGLSTNLGTIVDVTGTAVDAASSSTTAEAGDDLTTTVANDMVMTFCARQNDGGSWGPPTGFTLISSAGTTSGQDMGSGWAIQNKAVAGAVTVDAFSLAAGDNGASFGVAIALKPSAASTLFGAVNMPIAFIKDVSGIRKTFSSTATAITFSKDVSGKRKTFSSLAFPITFAKDVSGKKTTFGSIFVPITFGASVIGQRKTFGQIDSSIIFDKEVQGRRETFGALDLALSLRRDTWGYRTALSQIAFPIVFDKETAGFKTTFGQSIVPIIFDKNVLGKRHTFGQISLPIDVDIHVAAIVHYATTVLNSADKVYFGLEEVEAVYVGDILVWSNT